MNKQPANELSGIELIEDFRKNPNKYLPLHPYAFMSDRTGYGWNCGILEDNRPYFVDCWGEDGFTFADIIIAEIGYENITSEELKQKILKAGIYSLSGEGTDSDFYDLAKICWKRKEDDGNNYICFQLLIGDEDYTYMEGCPIYGFSLLNKYNSNYLEK